MGFSRRGRASGGTAPIDRRLKHQVASVCGLVEALMFDVAAWLAGVEQPVSPELNPRYPFNELRRLPRPRDRMAGYVSEGLLGSWGEVLDRWLAYGSRLQPHFGHQLALVVDGLGGPGSVKATFRFPNRSIILVGDRREYCGGDWQMTVEISPNLRRIETCLLRPASEGPRG
jgi:hypothetical protein